MSFKPYPKYKESGVEWLGRVPEHWELCRSDAVLGTCRSTISPEALAGTTVFHYSIPVVQLTGDGQLEDGSEIDSGKLVVTEPQVLVSKLNPRKGTVCIARPQEVLTVCSSEFVPLLPRRAAIRFVWYLVQSENYRTRLESLVESATKSHQRAAPSDICRVQWAFPPNEEQELISAFLDHETAKIDALIAEQQRLIELLQEKRQAVISHAVTKGLNPDAPMKDSGIEWLGEVPEHWETSRLKHATAKIVDCPHETPTYSDDGDYLVIRTPDLDDGRLLTSQMNRVKQAEYVVRTRREKLMTGDIVYSREGGRWGHAAIVPDDDRFCLGQRMMQFRAKEGWDGNYLMWHLTSRHVYSQGEVDTAGAASPHVNVATISNYRFTYPPHDEQGRIAVALDSIAARYDDLTDQAQKAISLLQERRSALISAAVTGQIDVRGFSTGGSEAA